MSSPGVPSGCILNVHVTLSSSAAAAAAVYGNLSSASTTAADGATCTASVPGAQATADACCASVSATCHLHPTCGGLCFADVASTESCTTADQGTTKAEKEESIALLGGEGGLIPDGAQIQLWDPDLDEKDTLFTTGQQVLMRTDAHLRDVRRYLKALEVCFFRSGTPESLPFIPHTLPTGERCIDAACF
jgi:hypothetical protein